MGILYRIIFQNGKSYIGVSSTTAQRRKVVHLHHARKGRPGALQAAIRKYGEESFSLVTLLVSNDWKYLCELERKAIAAYNTRSPEGYNLTDGGEGTSGTTRTPEQRARISERQKGKFLGRRFGNGDRHSDESRRKISEAGLGRTFSAATRAKIGATKIGNRYGVGRSVSEETKKRTSEAQRGLERWSAEDKLAMSIARRGQPWSAARRAAQEARRANPAS